MDLIYSIPIYMIYIDAVSFIFMVDTIHHNPVTDLRIGMRNRHTGLNDGTARIDNGTVTVYRVYRLHPVPGCQLVKLIIMTILILIILSFVIIALSLTGTVLIAIERVKSL